MKREPRIHYTPTDGGKQYASPCGADGRTARTTLRIANVTCKICRFQILADVADWAREFLDDLRAGKPLPIARPRAATKPVDGKVKGLGDGFARAFSQQGGSEKAVRELFFEGAPYLASVQPVVKGGGPPADAVRVEKRQVPEDTGDRSKVGHEPSRYGEPTE